MKSLNDIPLFILAVTAAIALALVAAFAMPHLAILNIGEGICLPAPADMIASPILSVALNIAVLLYSAFMAMMLNTRFNLEPGTQGAAGAYFLMATAPVLPLMGSLNAATIMSLVAIWCFKRLFSSRWKQNPAQDLFLVSSLLSLCSMCNYGFALMLIPLLIGAGVLKMLHFKSAIGALMGIAAPYIVVLGLGLVSPQAFHLPPGANPFAGSELPNVASPAVTAAILTAIAGILLLLREAVAIREVSSDEAALNSNINVWLICTIIFSVLDRNNFEVYYPTLCLCTGFRFAGLIGSRRFNAHGFVTLLAMIAYLIILLQNFSIWS